MSAAMALDAVTALVVHPAAELFPAVTNGDEFEALVDDIAEHGLRRPIVRTLKGAILDGRRRALACRLTGVTPKYAVHTGDPWRYVVTLNAHRFTGGNHRAMVGGEILLSSRLSGRQVMEMCGVSSMGSLMRAKAVARSGIDKLRELTSAGQVPLTTGARIAGLSPAAQETFCQRIERGSQPRHVGRPGWTGQDDGPTDPHHQLSQREARYRFVQEPALRTMAHSLDGLAIVLNKAEGLDPAISPEQAAHWRTDLSRQSRAFRRLMALLKERADQGA